MSGNICNRRSAALAAAGFAFPDQFDPSCFDNYRIKVALPLNQAGEDFSITGS
jgi:hypothetical protein